MTLHRPVKRRPCIKLIVGGETKIKRDIGPNELNLTWNIEPNFTMREGEELILRLCERPRMLPTTSIAEVSLSYTDVLGKLDLHSQSSPKIEPLVYSSGPKLSSGS